MRPTRPMVRLALASLATASAWAGRAEADPGEGGAASDVTVRGTSTGAAAGFVSKGAEADSTREVTDLASLVEPLPGVHVRRLGADDTFSTLSIRGSTSSEVAVLLAGVPLTGAADPSLDLASLPLWPGARVKVYRSFTPAAVGSGSLGGTLVLEPPRPTDAEGTLAWLGVGSFGEARLRLADVRAIDDGRARIVTALSAARATDDFSYYDPTHSTPTQTAYTTRQNAGYAALNGFTAVALPLDLGGGEPGTVTVTGLAQSRLQHLPGAATAPTLFAELGTHRELVSIDVAKPTGEAGAAHVVAWGRRDEVETHDTPARLNSGYEDVTQSTDDVTVGAGGAAAWRGVVARRLSLDARVDGSFERFAPGQDVSPLGSQPGATRASAGAGVDLDWRPLSSWGLSATGRVDTNVDAADPVGQASSLAAPSQGTEVHPTGHLGTEVVLGPVTLAAHGGALARPPSFVERFGGGGVLPSPTLASESALTVDAGGRYAAKGRGFRAQVELDGFATRATDLITLVPEGVRGLLKAENVASARIFGVEASADVRGHGLDLRVAYTGLLTFNDDPTACPVCATSPPLLGRPAHDLVGDVAYTLGPVRVRYGVDVVAGLYADLPGTLRVPDRVLQSTGARVAVPGVPTLKVGLDVHNLFDVRTGLSPGFAGPTREPIGDQFDYPLPGRSLLVTARWSPDGQEAPR